uniref:Mothers against decapentaplegic homolog n=1 Tax=Strongyloides papillosus TaxID=174720 RepID=A0A0N5B9F1_STREA
MNNLFTFHGPAVKKLLGWKQGDEEEKWAEKAVDSLVKKLRKKKSGMGTIEDLEYALANPGCVSKCVTIPKSLDGRLQVSHRKGLPHVIYCRVWRWPNLQSHHELKPIQGCLYPYDSNNKSEFICINPYHYKRIENTPQPILSIKSSTPQQLPTTMTNSPVSQYFNQGQYYNTPPPTIPSNFSDMNYQPYYNQTTQYYGPSPQSSIGSFTAWSPSALSDDDDNTINNSNKQYQLAQQVMYRPPVNDEPDYWCSVVYYELNTRVGTTYKITPLKVTIDGFTNPVDSSDRICLGLLSNVNRNSTIDNTRRHIGRGITLQLIETNVLLTNNSQFPVFVQSINSNYKMNLKPTTACRVPSTATMEIFNTNLFLEMLERAKLEGYYNVYDLQKMCYIRMSFAKGWGESYHRQDVTSTPCWLEIQLCKPLAHLDDALSIMEPPDNEKISSVS